MPTVQASINIPREEFEARAAALRGYIERRGLAGAVLFDGFRIFYYSGFAFIPTERPIVFVLSANGERALLVPQLEVEHAKAQTGFDRVEHYVEFPYQPHPMEVLAQMLSAMGIAGDVGADMDGYPWILGYRGPTLSDVVGGEVTLIADFVEDRMAVKSPAEVALIRESVKWGNLAHQLLQDYTRPGVTETEVSMRASDEATVAMYKALGPLYRAGTATGGAHAGYRGQIGRNAAIPHALANNITFREGDVLVTGAAAGMWGYHSELERTMIIGKPSQDQERMFGHMQRVQEIAIDSIRPGETCASVDKAVRSYFEEHNLMPYWKHHSGHAIGLRYHEGPYLDVGDSTVLQPGMVFTVEPGLYAPELGGFRHSDTVLVTEDGNEILTYYPRDLASLTIAV